MIFTVDDPEVMVERLKRIRNSMEGDIFQQATAHDHLMLDGMIEVLEANCEPEIYVIYSNWPPNKPKPSSSRMGSPGPDSGSSSGTEEVRVNWD